MPSVTAPLGAQRTASAVPPVEAPLFAIALSNLSFGTVLPGVTNTVLPSDSRRAGVFEIRGPSSASVRVEFALPSFLERESAHLPVSFGPGEASAGFARGAGDQFVFFNPHSPLVGSLSSFGRLFIRLGGTALPGLPQLGGEYRGTISITVYDLGS